MRTICLCLLLLVAAVSADLLSDFDDIERHLPMKQLELIGQKYVSTYPDIREGLLYLKGLPYDELFEKLVNIKEVRDLINYFDRHSIDAQSIGYHMIKKAADYHRKLLQKSSLDELNSYDVVITGDFLADCSAAIASVDMSSVILEKMKTSPDFANYVAALKNPEHMDLLYRVVRSKDFSKVCSDCMGSPTRGFAQKLWDAIKVL